MRRRAHSNAQQQQVKGPINIKVLRLSRPILQSADAASGPSLPLPELVLPKSGHTVYVGEEFGLIVSLIALEDISIKAKIEVRDPFGSLVSSLESGDELKPLAKDQSLPLLLKFVAKTTGSHALTVLVDCKDAVELQHIRKVFKFDASNAITVRHKMSRARQNAHVLEAQIENLTDSALTIESCALASTRDWAVQALDESSNVLLKPHDIYQYCFQMDEGDAREVGNLTISWRREPLGARGWQTTGIIQLD